MRHSRVSCSPTIRATALTGMAEIMVMTNASNSRVKPLSGRAHGTPTVLMPHVSQRNSDKQSGCPGENRSRYRGDVRQGQSRCGSRSMAGSEPTPVAAELCHAWLILRTRPVLLEPGAVLAAVKDAARRTSERWPAAILDCCCARPPAGRQAWVRGHWARLAGDGSLNALM